MRRWQTPHSFRLNCPLKIEIFKEENRKHSAISFQLSVIERSKSKPVLEAEIIQELKEKKLKFKRVLAERQPLGDALAPEAVSLVEGN